jgi:hypothetical protein
MVLVLILVSATAQMVSANPDSQSWHLLDVKYTGTIADDGTDHKKDLFMNKTGNATSNWIPLPGKKTAWWYAGHPAPFDGVTFGEDNWIVTINHSKTDGYTIFANVSKVNDSTGEVTYLANGSESASSLGVTIITCYDNPNTNQIFNANERLALRIYHNSTSARHIYYYNAADGKYSNLTSPGSDPGYPVPESAAIIMFSAGLLILAGYAYMGKRSK